MNKNTSQLCQHHLQQNYHLISQVCKVTHCYGIQTQQKKEGAQLEAEEKKDIEILVMK